MDLLVRDPDLVDAAHLARRTTLHPSLDHIRNLGGQSWDDAVTSLLTDRFDGRSTPLLDEFRDVVTWWLESMTRLDSGIAERMAWFWHGLLTTNAWKVEHGPLVANQLTTLRTHSMGSFRTLLHQFVADGALLSYLDADGSTASDPNENLGRELLELYSLGIGHYEQADVYAASQALAGAVVDRPSASVSRDEAAELSIAVPFLGERKIWNPESLVDRLCDHPATARRVASLLWRDLVGTQLDDAAATELGIWWQGQGLEVVPLLDRVLRDPAFRAARLNRARSGLEYYCATRAAVRFTIEDPWPAQRLGQLPYDPPSPAGWPSDRWLDPGSLLGRAAHSQGWWFEPVLKAGPTDLEAVLDLAGLFEISEATLAALRTVDTAGEMELPRRNLVRWSAVLSCPEYQLA